MRRTRGTDQPRRSLLYLPASNARALEKARTLPADAIIFDLEDAVAPDMKKEAREAAVKAVRDGRVHLSPKMPFGWVDFPPSVNRLIGLRWLAKILYPDKFPEDIRAQTREFYAMFYHRTPSDAQIDHVLAGRD